jgi:hypothetical protein
MEIAASDPRLIGDQNQCEPDVPQQTQALNRARRKLDSVRIPQVDLVDDDRSITIDERKPPRRGRQVHHASPRGVALARCEQGHKWVRFAKMIQTERYLYKLHMLLSFAVTNTRSSVLAINSASFQLRQDDVEAELNCLVLQRIKRPLIVLIRLAKAYWLL